MKNPSHPTADVSLSDDDREAVRQILLAEKERGVVDPLLPADVDLDGDGIADAFGLDAFGQVEVRRGVALLDTVFESTGEPVPEAG